MRILLIVLLSWVRPSLQYASYMCNVGRSYCTTPMTVGGTSIMGGKPKASTTRVVTVKRTPLGGIHRFDEWVSVPVTSADWVLEISGATFNAGYCSGKNRLYSSSGAGSTDWTIAMPTTPGTTVSIFGAWASGQTAISISTAFTMVAVAGVPAAAPTPEPTWLPPTAIPTALPTTSVPTTALPTALPTRLPSPLPTVAGQTNPPSAVPTTGPPSVPPTPRPTALPSAAPTALKSTPSPTLSLPNQPSPEPTGIPATAPSFTARVAFTISGVSSIDDWNKNVNTALSIVATTLNIPQSDLVFLPLMPASSPHRRRRSLLSRLRRRLQAAGSFSGTLLIIGQPSAETALSLAQSAGTYLSASFTHDYNQVVSGAKLSSVVAQPATASTASPVDSYHAQCKFNPSLSLYWNFLADGSVDAMMALTSSVNWLSGGIVALDETNMVTQLPVSNKVYLYAPTLSYVGYIAMLSQSSTTDDPSAFTQETAVRNGGITAVQNVEGLSTMSFTIPVDTGVGQDVQLDPVDHNTFIWAHGGEWPETHPEGAYGFSQMYWSSGNCKQLIPPQHPSPYWIFVLLTALALYNSPYSPLSRLRVVHWLNQKRIDVGFLGIREFSVPGLCFVLLYLVVNAVVFFVSNAKRRQTPTWINITLSSGIVCIMNFWMAMLPTSKTTVLQQVFGVPFERSVKYHRVVVGVAMLWGLIHLLSNWYANPKVFYSAEEYGPAAVRPVYGFAAFIMYSAMSLLAIEPVRRFSYELFMGIHHFHWIATLMVYLHVELGASDLALGFLPGIVLHAVDALRKLVRHLLRVEPVTAELELSGDVVHLVVPVPVSIWSRIGSFFGIMQPDTAIELVGKYMFINISAVSRTQWHPFSIAHIDRDAQVMHFYIRSAGLWSWTQALVDLIRSQERSLERVRSASTMPPPPPKYSLESIKKAVMELTGTGPVTRLTVAMDGPHGCLSLDTSRYETLNFVAGGIGITPWIHLCETIVYNAATKPLSGPSKHFALLKSVKLVWVVRDLALVELFQRQIDEMYRLVFQGVERGSIFAMDSPFVATVEYTGTSPTHSRRLNSDSGAAAPPPPPPPPPPLPPRTHQPQNQKSEFLSITVYCTSARGGGKPDEPYVPTQSNGTPFNPNIHFRRGRPPIATLVEEIKVGNQNKSPGALLVCGPGPLTRELLQEGTHQGIDVHVETFAF